MGRQFLAARVLQTAEARLTKGGLRIPTIRADVFAPMKNGPETAPAWLKAVAKVAPSETLTRPYPVQHTERRDRKSGRKLHPHRNMFRPTRIVHPEDELRRDFFRDHPWELARPRMLLELDGQDARHRDWSKGLRQPGMALSGECVVQRQLWLMENHGLSKQAAYDVARKEFYHLRHQEEVERRLAVEEARMYGAYFGQDYNRVGMQLEDAAYERWKKWAGEQIAQIDLQRAEAYSSVVDEAEEIEAAVL
ncbi:hypothetical protein VTJ83DRAFT_6386 [Remersonia thermophila]|uniref:37S ribosomal protein S25, mitochondrial n=1 Tax=Remersonia thermophila TaxID=72144 RepID=A0ABR4D4J8_9PEZI